MSSGFWLIANDLKLEPTNLLRRAAVKAILTTCLLMSLLVSGWLATDHALHESIHADAGSSDHVCLAVLLTGGQAEPVPSDLVLESWIGFTSFLVWDATPAHVSDFELGSHSGRGPPQFLL